MRGGPQDLLIPICLVFISMLGVGSIAAPGHAGGPVAAVFPPWWDLTQSVSTASRFGTVIAVGAIPSIVVMQPEPGADVSGLHGAGAWGIMAPEFVLGCLTP